MHWRESLFVINPAVYDYRFKYSVFDVCFYKKMLNLAKLWKSMALHINNFLITIFFDSLRPIDAYIRQYTNQYWFR